MIKEWFCDPPPSLDPPLRPPPSTDPIGLAMKPGQSYQGKTDKAANRYSDHTDSDEFRSECGRVISELDRQMLLWNPAYFFCIRVDFFE